MHSPTPLYHAILLLQAAAGSNRLRPSQTAAPWHPPAPVHPTTPCLTPCRRHQAHRGAAAHRAAAAAHHRHLLAHLPRPVWPRAAGRVCDLCACVACGTVRCRVSPRQLGRSPPWHLVPACCTPSTVSCLPETQTDAGAGGCSAAGCTGAPGGGGGWPLSCHHRSGAARGGTAGEEKSGCRDGYRPA